MPKTKPLRWLYMPASAERATPAFVEEGARLSTLYLLLQLIIDCLHPVVVYGVRIMCPAPTAYDVYPYNDEPIIVGEKRMKRIIRGATLNLSKNSQTPKVTLTLTLA